MENFSDRELISSYLNDGNQDSLDFIIKRYIKNVYNFSYGLTKAEALAEDITQETFVKIWKNLKKFDQNKNFKTWIFSIAKNTAIDHLRKKKAVPFSDFDDDKDGNKFEDFIVDKEPGADEVFEISEKRESVIEAINELPIIYRSVLLLRFSEGLKFEEIAEISGESSNTIKSRARRAIVMIKNRLKA